MGGIYRPYRAEGVVGKPLESTKTHAHMVLLEQNITGLSRFCRGERILGERLPWVDSVRSIFILVWQAGIFRGGGGAAKAKVPIC